MVQTQKYIENNKARYLSELFDLLRVPSISADPAYAGEMLKTAQIIKAHLEEAGVDFAEICETAGNPIVYAEKIVDKNAPTVVIYGHYDVQPDVPLDLWETPPFEPTIRKTAIHPDGAIFARGSCDDKGQLFMHVKAFEAMVANNELPCNVKFMIEGEEEIGSTHLGIFVKENKEKLSGDIILISDTGMIANDVPSITTGLRGLCAVEVKVTGPNRDLHSGLYGGAVANPANILAGMLAKLHNENNRVTIPGFYDDVIELSLQERTMMAKAPFNEADYKKSIGIPEVHGESGYSTPERQSIRPTLDINGMWSGYTGEGAKTIIPSTAHAKITMRLVPDQTPDKVGVQFETYFKSLAPDAVTVEVEVGHGGTPYVSPIDSPAYLAASKAMETTFGKTPVPVRSGGSIPIVSLFEEELGMKTILLGFGLDSDAIHSPNEHYGLFNFYKGIETIPYFYQNFANDPS